MAAEPTSAEWEPSRRLPRARLGVAVVEEIVELIVTGKLKEGELLPPEGALCEHFGVSRTVLRESVKRLEEKGLVHVGQGRGTQVARSGSWNVLDHVVLSAMIDSDDSLAVLDELTVVRSALEAKMAGAGSQVVVFTPGIANSVAFTMHLPHGVDSQITAQAGDRLLSVASTRKDGDAAKSQASATAAMQALIAAG